MPEQRHGGPDLDARLAQIDRRLSEIQADLAPVARRAAAPLPGLDEVRALTGEQRALAASLRDVLGGFEAALTGLSAALGGEVSVVAGPLHSIDRVRVFERELRSLPSVREVTRRSFEGLDRAVIDVSLGRASA